MEKHLDINSYFAIIKLDSGWLICLPAKSQPLKAGFNQKNMKKVALYCRLSSKAEEQGTLQSQVSELREVWKNHQIVGEYLDDGWSGEVLERPGLDKLRSDGKAGLLDIVSVHSIDRLSRNLYHQGIIVEELKKEGIEVFIKDKPIADSPEGKFLFNVLGAVAEFEKEKILERTRRGRIYKVKTKKILGYIPPYGYDYHRKTPEREGYFTINQKEAEVVRLIFDLYIQLQSMTAVQKELALKGIKPRKSEKWCRSVVSAVLRNEGYTGIGYYNKRQSIVIESGKRYQRKAKSGTRIRPKSEWLEVRFPKTIDEKVFKLAQTIRLKKFKPFGKSKYFYLLSGLVRCALCGSTFTGSYNGSPNKYTYYRCTDRRKRFPNPQHCRTKHMRADRIEPAVWSAVSEAVTDQRILSSHILQSADKAAEGGSSLEEKREELIRQKECLAFKKKRLDDLYFKGLKSIEDYEKQIGEFQAEENGIERDLKEIENREQQIICKSLVLQNINYFCNLAKQKVRSFGPVQKQEFLRYLLEEILLDSNTGTTKITGYVPVEKQDFEHLFAQLRSTNSVQMRPVSTVQKPCVNP